MPAKRTENDHWHEQTPANPASQQMGRNAPIPFQSEAKNSTAVVQNIEKNF